MKSLLMAGLLLLLLAGHNTVYAGNTDPVLVEPDMTLAEIAHAHDIRGGDLAEALGLARQVDKQRTLQDLGVNLQDAQRILSTFGTVDGAVAGGLRRGKGEGERRGYGRGRNADAGKGGHQEREAVADRYNYLLWPVLLAGALWWLLRGGRMEDGSLLPVNKRYRPVGFHAALVLVVLFFGFASGKSPNPMEGLVKFVKALAGFYDDPWIKLGFLLFFTVLAVLGTKLVCGWGCPFGALQEIVYDLPLLPRGKKLRLPFLFTMSVRTLLFGLFLFFISGLAGPKWVLYHGINPFNLFGFEFSQASIGVTIGICLLLSVVIYRPFCQMVCPFGWYAWFLEKIALTGIRIDHKACTACGACDRACPVEAAHDRLAGKALPAECFSCARCLRVCPVDAIDYGPRWRPKR
jgi:ferredoxin